jgi:hypothetical protein
MEKIECLNKEELALITYFNTKSKVKSVYYYFWINTSNPHEHYSLIDGIELVFDDNEMLFFKINEDDSGINVSSKFDFDSYKKNLEKQFNNTIIYKKTDVSTLKLWKGLLQNPFQEITTVVEKGKALSTPFWVDFKQQKAEINFHPIGGLIASEYDDSLD